uniref:Glycosyltransferase subfamily 4-like N-terminal domain-containing protein n=1 Tax=Bionectria ochroleuca TaxID=29856 RepID=A0A8H7TM12_BIOOC
MSVQQQSPTMAAYPDHDLSQFPASLKDKRILLCTESFGPVNGVSRTTLMLVNHLRANGAQVAVVAPHNHTKHNTFTPPPSPSLSPADKPQPEVRVTGYPLPFNPELSIVYPVRNSSLYSRTFGLDAPPDIIYLASPASLGFQVMLQLRQQPADKQIPIICNFQTDLAGYCSILFPAPLSHIAVYTFAAVQSYLFRHSSIKTIFYPSKFVQRYLASQNVQEEKMELLTRGVNTEMFNPGRRSEQLRREIAPNGEIIFVTVSRIAGEKGFDFLAKTAKELDTRGVPYKFLIVGGNRNPDMEKEVQDLLSRSRSKARSSSQDSRSERSSPPTTPAATFSCTAPSPRHSVWSSWSPCPAASLSSHATRAVRQTSSTTARPGTWSRLRTSMASSPRPSSLPLTTSSARAWLSLLAPPRAKPHGTRSTTRSPGVWPTLLLRGRGSRVSSRSSPPPRATPLPHLHRAWSLSTAG